MRRWYFDSKLVREDETVPVQVTVQPDRDQDGHCDGWVLWAHDTRYGSEVKLTSREEEQLQREAEQHAADRQADYVDALYDRMREEGR